MASARGSGEGLGQFPRVCSNPDCPYGGKVKLTGDRPLAFSMSKLYGRRSFHFYPCWVTSE